MPSAVVPDISEFEPKRDACKIGKFEFSPEQRAKFEAACKAGRIPHARIAKVLSGWGFKVTPATVQTHRSGACGCAG